MLLDELFAKIIPARNIWIRKNGQLIKEQNPVTGSVDLKPLHKPLFPISKPRYPEK